MMIIVIGCLFAALLARLWFLQVINVHSAEVVASDNGIETVYIPAPRGEILDRNGKVLVGNVDDPLIEVDRQEVGGDTAVEERLAVLLGMTLKQIQTQVADIQYSPYAPVPMKLNPTTSQILYIQENPTEFPGVKVTTQSVPTYTAMGKAAANIVGYVGQISQSQYKALKSKGYQPGDQIGIAGIEATYESVLRGTPGVQRIQVDSQGNVLTTLSTTPPVPGLNLRLSIDGKVQEAAVASLQSGLAAARVSKHDGVNFPAPAGAAVVEDPQDGSLLALATYPDYDPSEFTNSISQAQYNAYTTPSADDPLLDRAIAGVYAPGSTFKLVTATAGLQYGLITPTSIFQDSGSIRIGDQTFTNDNGEVLGAIDLPTALTESSDNYFNEIGAELWDGYVNGGHYSEDALQQIADEYGFNSATGVALPGESSGLIPTPQSVAYDFKEYPNQYETGTWYTGDSAQTAIGQFEVGVTPLQLANAYSTFANGGTLWQPNLALDAETAAGKVVRAYKAQKKGTVALTTEQRAAILAGLIGVVQDPDGTAAGIFTGALTSKDIAGKTGTAQVQGKQSTSIFTSFAPASDPQFEVTAILEQAGYGADIAGPVVREIYDDLYNLPSQLPTVVDESGDQN